MNNIFNKLILILFASVMLFSCGEDDDSILRTEAADVTITEFLSVSEEFDDYNNTAARAYIDASTINEFDLGATFVNENLNTLLEQYPLIVQNIVSPIRTGETFNGAELSQLISENSFKTDNVISELTRYLDAVNEQVNLAMSNGNTVDESLLSNVEPFDLTNEDVYSVLDLLNSRDNKFTVLFKSEANANGLSGQALGNLLLSNIIQGEFSDEDLKGVPVATAIAGNELTISVSDNPSNDGSVVDTAFEPLIVEINSSILVDKVLRNIRAKGNGIMHMVDNLAEIP